MLNDHEPLIQVSTQQSRFHAATLDTAEIDLQGISISVGEKDILVDAVLTLKEGTRYGIIGKNGAGKSTLFKALADRLIPGLSASLRVHLVSQIDETAEGKGGLTALEAVLSGHRELRQLQDEASVLQEALESSDDAVLGDTWRDLEREKATRELDEARRIASRRSGARGKKARDGEIQAEQAVMAVQSLGLEGRDVRPEAMTRLEELRLKLELVSICLRSRLWQLASDTSEAHVRSIMSGLGFTPSMISGPYLSLSGGWRSRVRLATALIVQTDILILDEPTNFMDLSALLWLERTLPTLSSYSTLIVTSHDQTFLDRVAEKTIALRHQRLDYFDGPPGSMYEVEAEARRAMSTVQDALAKKKEHIQESIAAGRKAAKANGDENRQRMVKSRQKKLDERWGLEQSAKGTRFKLNRDLGGYHLTRRAEVVVQAEEAEVVWRFDQPAEMRQKEGSLVSLEKVGVGWEGRAIVGGVDLVIHPGARIALVGANGRGKSTLARVLSPGQSPISGIITRHPQARVHYFDQHAVQSLSSTSDASAIAHFLAACADATESQARGMLGRLGLSGATASQTPISQLSGGQKVRLVLTCLMFRPPHLLILDEVTTHLDVASIRALAAALAGWRGAVVLVTHDRWFAKAVIGGEIQRVGSTVQPTNSETGDTPGQTFLVGKGGLKELQGGIDEYERRVERKL